MKQTIEPKVKEKVWKSFFQDKKEYNCLCCAKIKIKDKSFSAGHIISEAHGGLAIIENLIPICKECNNKCQQKNLIEFAKQEYNHDIIPNDKYWEYYKNIQEGKDLFYNTKQVIKDITKNCKEKTQEIALYVFKNIDIRDIYDTKYIKDQDSCRIWYEKICNDLLYENFYISNIKYKRSESINYDESENKLFFLIKKDDTYNINIKIETKTLRKTQDIKSICKKDLESNKYIDVDIQYNIEDIDGKEYVYINNRVYSWTGLRVGVEVNYEELLKKKVNYKSLPFYNDLNDDEKNKLRDKIIHYQTSSKILLSQNFVSSVKSKFCEKKYTIKSIYEDYELNDDEKYKKMIIKLLEWEFLEKNK
jgi:hypothetical protein